MAVSGASPGLIRASVPVMLEGHGSGSRKHSRHFRGTPPGKEMAKKKKKKHKHADRGVDITGSQGGETREVSTIPFLDGCVRLIAETRDTSKKQVAVSALIRLVCVCVGGGCTRGRRAVLRVACYKSDTETLPLSPQATHQQSGPDKQERKQLQGYLYLVQDRQKINSHRA